MSCARVHVGVSALIRDDDGRMLMVKRAGSHGAGTWAFPGGWMEQPESPPETAVREVMEELGVEVRPLVSSDDVVWTFDVHPEGLVGCTFCLEAEIVGGTPRICEPDKITEIGWFAFDALPEPLFQPLLGLIERWPF